MSKQCQYKQYDAFPPLRVQLSPKGSRKGLLRAVATLLLTGVPAALCHLLRGRKTLRKLSLVRLGLTKSKVKSKAFSSKRVLTNSLKAHIQPLDILEPAK